MQKIKIAEVVPEMLPMPPVLGGAVELLTYELSLQLAKKKEFDVTIFSRPPEGQLIKSKSDNKLNYAHIPFTKTDKFFLQLKSRVSWKNPIRYIAKFQNVHYYSLKAAKKISTNFDIVHLHNDPTMVVNIRKHAPHSKIILHMHNNHLAEGGLLKYKYAQALKLSDKVLFVSHFLLEQASKQYPEFIDKFEVVYNGVDATKFKPLPTKAKQKFRKSIGLGNEPLILYVGRLIPEKGVHVLLSSFDAIKKKVPKAKLLVVGSSWFGKNSESKYIQNLKNISSKFEKDIIFTGYTNHDQMPALFSSADVFVCPSSWDEPFGLVCAEAMACQTPVIITQSGGLVEMLPKKYAFIAKKENPEDLAEKIVSLLKNKNKIKLGIEQRKIVLSKFSLSIFAEKLEKIFKKNLSVSVK